MFKLQSGFTLVLFICTILLAVYLYIKNRKIFIRQFSPQKLDVNTPDEYLPTSVKDISNFQDSIARGRDYAKKQRVVICGLLRDGEENLDRIRERAEGLAKLFYDYRILIVENDSTDGTREKLLEWSAHNPKVKILGCGVNAKTCNLKLEKTEKFAPIFGKGESITHARIDKMVYLRNLYLRYIKNNLKNFNYMIVWDMDILGSVYEDGVLSSFGILEEDRRVNPTITSSAVEGICGYGFRDIFGYKHYYDNYAHIAEGEKYLIPGYKKPKR